MLVTRVHLNENSRFEKRMSSAGPLTELLRKTPIGATLDSTRRHRYSLTREVADAPRGGRPILFCGYNPSTADETADDPTLRRETGFTRALNGEYLIKVNLLTYRAADPNEIDFIEAERTFEENVARVADLAALTLQAGGTIIAAWGAPKGPKNVQALAAEAARMLIDENQVGVRWRSFGLTKGGDPKHPLYLPKTAWKDLADLSVLQVAKRDER